MLGVGLHHEPVVPGGDGQIDGLGADQLLAHGQRGRRAELGGQDVVAHDVVTREVQPGERASRGRREAHVGDAIRDRHTLLGNGVRGRVDRLHHHVWKVGVADHDRFDPGREPCRRGREHDRLAPVGYAVGHRDERHVHRGLARGQRHGGLHASLVGEAAGKNNHDAVGRGCVAGNRQQRGGVSPFGNEALRRDQRQRGAVVIAHRQRGGARRPEPLPRARREHIGAKGHDAVAVDQRVVQHADWEAARGLAGRDRDLQRGDDQVGIRGERLDRQRARADGVARDRHGHGLRARALAHASSRKAHHNRRGVVVLDRDRRLATVEAVGAGRDRMGLRRLRIHVVHRQHRERPCIAAGRQRHDAGRAQLPWVGTGERHGQGRGQRPVAGHAERNRPAFHHRIRSRLQREPGHVHLRHLQRGRAGDISDGAGRDGDDLRAVEDAIPDAHNVDGHGSLALGDEDIRGRQPGGGAAKCQLRGIGKGQDDRQRDRAVAVALHDEPRCDASILGDAGDGDLDVQGRGNAGEVGSDGGIVVVVGLGDVAVCVEDHGEARVAEGPLSGHGQRVREGHALAWREDVGHDKRTQHGGGRDGGGAGIGSGNEADACDPAVRGGEGALIGDGIGQGQRTPGGSVAGRGHIPRHEVRQRRRQHVGLKAIRRVRRAVGHAHRHRPESRARREPSDAARHGVQGKARGTRHEEVSQGVGGAVGVGAHGGHGEHLSAEDVGAAREGERGRAIDLRDDDIEGVGDAGHAIADGDAEQVGGGALRF